MHAPTPECFICKATDQVLARVVLAPGWRSEPVCHDCALDLIETRGADQRPASWG